MPRSYRVVCDGCAIGVEVIVAMVNCRQRRLGRAAKSVDISSRAPPVVFGRENNDGIVCKGIDKMSLNKPLTGLLLLAGAAGGPYMLFETDAGNQAQRLLNPAASSSGDSGYLTGAASGSGGMPSSGFWNANGVEPSQLVAGADGEPFVQAPIYALREVLRFDISPNWVPQRFQRVSTVLAEQQLDGLRVPLITGTTPSDLAGTLTYYFDRYKRVQRVTVHGVTGDPSRFIAELQHAYQLQQQPSLGGGLYLLKWNGRPTSVVYTAPASVISADSPYARYNVFIEINQAGLEYGLSDEAQQLVSAGQQTNRWQ